MTSISLPLIGMNGFPIEFEFFGNGSFNARSYRDIYAKESKFRLRRKSKANQGWPYVEPTIMTGKPESEKCKPGFVSKFGRPTAIYEVIYRVYNSLNTVWCKGL